MSIVVGLYGCAPDATPAVTKAIPCTPANSRANIYKLPLASWARTIFQFAATPPIPDANVQEQQARLTRYHAFQYLIKATRRWSDTETVILDNSSEAQITIIFVHPELVAAVFLSQLLKERLYNTDFDARIQSILNEHADRNELLFLVIITSTKYESSSSSHSPQMIDLPISEMSLMNAEDVHVSPSHDDHIIDDPIYISFGPSYGYLAYPVAIEANNECKWLLDPQYNTSIVLNMPSIQVNGAVRGPHAWSIQYASLIDPGLPSWSPTFSAIPEGFNQDLISPLPTPPIPPINLATTDDENSIDNFWRDIARFIWGQILLINF